MSAVAAVATVLGSICLLTAVLDMMMNGGAYADWAPYGFGIAAVCGILVWLFGP